MKHFVDRQRYLIDFTMASLLRRKGRNFILFAVYTLVIFILGSVMLFSHALRREAAQMLDHSPRITIQAISMGRHALIGGEYLDFLGKIRGVQYAEGRLWGYFFDQASRANYTLMAPSKRDQHHRIKAGEAMVGQGVARARHLSMGKPLFLLSPSGKMFKLKITQIFAPESEIVSSDLVLVSPEDFRRFYQIPPDVFTDLALSVRNAREIDKIVEKASKKIPGARFITRRDILRTYEAIFSWREGLLLALLGASIIAFAIFAFDKASGLSADERREIGILKAVGWETGDILAMKFWEGALISLAAFFTGFLLAYAHVFFFDAGLLEPVLKGWAVIYPRFSLPPAIDGLQIATLAFFTIIPYTAATIIPIWRAAIADPDMVMR
ncbi:MAG TPA: FtsX-like permease family protein [Rhizobiales bacterium]|nr:FtsX-like permease family protein [Hyphomicrobiales bacterium]